MALTKEDRNFFQGENFKLFSRFCSFVKQFQLSECFEKGIIVGFSGGCDSIFLLLLLLQYQQTEKQSFPMVAVHVNHGIRGKEADRDAAFCEKFCQKYGISFRLVNCDVPTSAKIMKKGTEETARILRYDAFEKIKREENCQYLVTAHHANDNLETVLFHILRGTGTRGLCGIRPVFENRLHPLLSFTKAEIVKFCSDHQIEFVSDSTNESDTYTRNYIRRHIVPTLYEISANPEEAVLTMSMNALADQDYILTEAEKIIEKYPDFHIPKQELLQLHPAIISRLIPKISARFTDIFPSSKQINSILEGLKKGIPFSVCLPSDVCFVYDGNAGYCRLAKEEEAYFSETLCEDVIRHFEKQGFSVLLSYDDKKISEARLTNVYKYSTQMDLSSVILNGNVTVRSKNDGDTYRYGGMTHKIKKLFNDKKVPLPLRSVIPVFEDNNGVFWVPGFGVREDKVKDQQGPFIFLGYDNPDFPITAKEKG